MDSMVIAKILATGIDKILDGAYDGIILCEKVRNAAN